jgi:hypothetical protein
MAASLVMLADGQQPALACNLSSRSACLRNGGHADSYLTAADAWGVHRQFDIQQATHPSSVTAERGTLLFGLFLAAVP